MLMASAPLDSMCHSSSDECAGSSAAPRGLRGSSVSGSLLGALEVFFSPSAVALALRVLVLWFGDADLLAEVPTLEAPERRLRALRATGAGSWKPQSTSKSS